MTRSRRSRAAKANREKYLKAKALEAEAKAKATFPTQTDIVKGSFHQGDTRQFSECTAGKQCSCNALVALTFIKLFEVITPAHIDKVLQVGDNLYGTIRKRLLNSNTLHISEYLTTKDLPTEVFIDYVLHKLKYFGSIYGRFSIDDCDSSDVEAVDVIVQRAFSLSDTNIMVIGSYMIALFRDGRNQYGIFDSHSRNNVGLVADDGNAVLLYFSSIPDLMYHLHKLRKSLSMQDCTRIEIRPIAIKSTTLSSSGTLTPSSQNQNLQQKKVPCTDTSVHTSHMAERKSQQRHINGGSTTQRVTSSKAPDKMQPASLFGSITNDTSPQVFAPGKETMAIRRTAEGSNIELLASDIQKLDNYLSSEMQKSYIKLVKDPSCSGYVHLSVATAAKIMLFNKPRANEAIQLTVASFNMSTKLDPTDEEIMRCLSNIEEKLCERLDVVKTSGKDGKMVPILITPWTKKAMELLVATRPLVNINPMHPYIFAKCNYLVDSMAGSIEVLNTVAINAGLLRDSRLEKHVATISQIMAMEDNELDWLTSHIAQSVTDGIQVDVHNVQTSAHEMAKVVQQLHAIDSGQGHHYNDKTISQLQLSDVTRVPEVMEVQQVKNNSDVSGNATVTKVTENMEEQQEEDHSDGSGIIITNVTSIAEDMKVSQELNNSDVSGNTTVTRVTENMEEQQEDGHSDGSGIIITNVTSIAEDMEVSQELNNSDVSGNANVPNNAENLEELQEGKMSDFQSRVDKPSNTDNVEVPQEIERNGKCAPCILQVPGSNPGMLLLDLTKILLEACNVGINDRVTVQVKTKPDDTEFREEEIKNSIEDEEEMQQVVVKDRETVQLKIEPDDAEFREEEINNGIEDEEEIQQVVDKDTPIMVEHAEEPVEEKYSDILRKTNIPNIAEDTMAQQEDDKSVIRISVDVPNIIQEAEEPLEEKYSDVLRRDNMTNIMEEEEEEPEEKYSDVLKRDKGKSKDGNSRRHKQKYNRGTWTKKEVEALWSSLGNFIAAKRLPQKLHIIKAQEQQPILGNRRWNDIRKKIRCTIKNKGFIDYI